MKSYNAREETSFSLQQCQTRVTEGSQLKKEIDFPQCTLVSGTGDRRIMARYLCSCSLRATINGAVEIYMARGPRTRTNTSPVEANRTAFEAENHLSRHQLGSCRLAYQSDQHSKRTSYAVPIHRVDDTRHTSTTLPTDIRHREFLDVGHLRRLCWVCD